MPSSKVTKKTAPAKKPNVKKPVPAKKPVTKSSAPKPMKGGSKVVPKKVATKKPVPKKKTVNNKKVNQKGGNASTRPRFFKLVLGDETPTGRFSGKKPKQAANKALTTLLKARKEKGEGVEGELKFSIVECTRGRKNKQYFYTGQRVELSKPTEVTIKKEDGTKDTITYNYTNKVYKDKSPEA